MENPPKEIASLENYSRAKEIFQVSGQMGQSATVFAVRHLPLLCPARYFNAR
jgi:hypothetical protein